MDLERWRNTNFPAREEYKWEYLACEVWPCIMDGLQKLAKHTGATEYNIDRYAERPHGLHGVNIRIGEFLGFIRCDRATNAGYIQACELVESLRESVEIYSNAQRMMSGFCGPMFLM